MSTGAPNKSDNTKYYEILGVSKNTSPADMWKAYGKAAIQIRFDNGGDSEKLKELAQAYQVLSHPLKRRIYDERGEDGLKEAGRTSSGSPRKWRLLGQDIVLPLLVSLEELYNGSNRTIPFSQIEICSKCNGKGSKSGPSVKCSGCQGSGAKPRLMDIGHPLIELPYPCDGCKGTGEAIREIIYEDRCEQCKGEKVFQLNKVFKFDIKKGMQNGQIIKSSIEVVSSGEHAFFMIQQIVHPKFKRKGDDLFVEHTISLREALFGFKSELALLDKRRLKIESQPGEVIHPGQVKEINDEGMPMYERPYKRGKLHIRFTVEFPVSLTPDQSKLFEALLHPRPDMEEVETAKKPRGV